MLLLGLITLTMLYALPSKKHVMSNAHYMQISTIIIILTSVLTINSLNIQYIGYKITLFSGLLNISNFNLIITLIITIFSSLILIVLPVISTRAESSEIVNSTLGLINNIKDIVLSNAKEYSLLTLIFLFGGLLLVYSSDFIIFAISLELQSFSLYIITILYKSRNATISGIKYFILGSLASAITFLGIALVYSETGSFNYDSIFILLDVMSNYKDNSILLLGFSLIVLGLLFKLGAAPLHFWSPDVYDQSKTSYTIWLNVMPKLTILTVLIQIVVGLNNLDNNIISTILYISCVLSLIIGAVLGLSQNNLKRLFTYSTINHIGFMLLSLNSDIMSINSLLFYLVQYTISTLTLFCIMLALVYTLKTDDNINHSNAYSDVNKISSIVGLFFYNPLLALSLAITMFSFSGIPPLNGFFSKFYVLESALSLGNYFIAILAIIVSVISAAYYLKIVLLMFTPKSEISNNNLISYSNTTGLSNIHSNIIIILTLIQLLYMAYPNLMLNSVQLLSLSLFNN